MSHVWRRLGSVAARIHVAFQIRCLADYFLEYFCSQ